MASKIQMAKFNKKVEAIVLSMGGTLNSSLPYHWSVQTKVGKLFVTVHEAEASKLFSIFCCFEDEKLANEVLTESNKSNFNSSSGKFNFHYSDEETCLRIFTSSLNEIEQATEIAGLYDLRLPFGSGVSINEGISRAIRDCFFRHNGKLNKALLDATIKAIGKHTPEYKIAWKDFKETFEVKTKVSEYINPFHIS
jgi:hypothetical protein